MNALPGWRRAAVKLARHAAAVLPGASPWARAMQHELDYIEDDRAALAWALGCVLASYKARLAGARTREVLRHAVASGALMLAIGLALLENGGGQAAPAPPPPVPDETACDKADKPSESGLGLERNPARTLPLGTISGRPAPETPCTDRSAPLRVRPEHEMRVKYRTP
jgi:hypothetical protein